MYEIHGMKTDRKSLMLFLSKWCAAKRLSDNFANIYSPMISIRNMQFVNLRFSSNPVNVVVITWNCEYQHLRSRKAHYSFRIHSKTNPKYVSVQRLYLFYCSVLHSVLTPFARHHARKTPFVIFFWTENRKRRWMAPFETEITLT